MERSPHSIVIPSPPKSPKNIGKKASQEKKIELILGDARESVLQLEKEIKEKKRPQFDLAFIDADKAGYEVYWEAAIKLVRKGGAILVDNVLWSGTVINPQEKTDHVIHAFNEKVKADPRVEKAMLPIRDGIYLARVL